MVSNPRSHCKDQCQEVPPAPTNGFFEELYSFRYYTYVFNPFCFDFHLWHQIEVQFHSFACGYRVSPGEVNGTPLQYSCLENPMDREEPGRLQSMGSHRVGHDWSDLAAACSFPSTICLKRRCFLAMFSVLWLLFFYKTQENRVYSLKINYVLGLLPFGFLPISIPASLRACNAERWAAQSPLAALPSFHPRCAGVVPRPTHTLEERVEERVGAVAPLRRSLPLASSRIVTLVTFQVSVSLMWQVLPLHINPVSFPQISRILPLTLLFCSISPRILNEETWPFKTYHPDWDTLEN